MSTPPRPPGMRRDPEEKRVTGAQSELAARLDAFQAEHRLTDVEMLQAVTSWQATVLKYMHGPLDLHAPAPAPAPGEEDS